MQEVSWLRCSVVKNLHQVTKLKTRKWILARGISLQRSLRSGLDSEFGSDTRIIFLKYISYIRIWSNVIYHYPNHGATLFLAQSFILTRDLTNQFCCKIFHIMCDTSLTIGETLIPVPFFTAISKHIENQYHFSCHSAIHRRLG